VHTALCALSVRLLASRVVASKFILEPFCLGITSSIGELAGQGPSDASDASDTSDNSDTSNISDDLARHSKNPLP